MFVSLFSYHLNQLLKINEQKELRKNKTRKNSFQNGEQIKVYNFQKRLSTKTVFFTISEKIQPYIVVILRFVFTIFTFSNAIKSKQKYYL